MIVFHGSNVIVDKPSIQFARNNLDFGKGFYVTLIEEQAISWAKRYNIERLKYEKKNNQICIKSQMIIDKYLKFEGSNEYVGR